MTLTRRETTLPNMQCAKCGTDLLPGKPFCHACGAPAPTACPQCGREVQPGFRFCPDCGHEIAAAPPVAAAAAPAPNERLARLASQVPREVAERMLAVGGAMAGERKRVTVLFCDLVGSTAIAEKLDPELYHDLLENYLALAFREIYHLDGFVNQLAGDGLMALFGAPIPHEDAPNRAVRAALAIRDALAAFNVQRRAEGAAELRIRIGINTGPVLVGAIGNDLKMDYTAIGDTTNVAARLQSLADPGSILMSEDTYRLVRGFFAVREKGRFEVKGKSEPVGAYEILGLSDATSPMAIAAARGLTPFVGRDEELAQLMGCYDRMTSRLAQVVAIVGDAGSGKSRLLYEFKQQLVAREAVVLEARCSSLTQMQPYAPWNQMIRLYCGISSRDSDEVACGKVERTLRAVDEKLLDKHGALCAMLGINVKGVEGVDADELRRMTFTAMSDLFVALTHRAPTIMLIEDLHWMDDASRETIELAVTRIERGRLMVLVSHRPDFQPNWRTRAAFTQIFMRSLLDETIDEITRAILGGTPPAELASMIRLKAEGNPFFAEEIARIVLEEGYVVHKDGGLALTRPISELRMPGTVEEVLGARLDRLGPQAKRVTQVAAVLGRQFRKSQLLSLLGTEQIDVAAQLEDLEQRGVLHRKTVLSDDEYRFGESLTQDVAYESLLLKERRQLHERVAELLRAESTPSAELSVLLAHHLGRSSNHLGALQALLSAAAAAEKAPSYPTAAKLYRQAWEMASDALGENGEEAMSRLAIDAVIGLLRMHVVYSTADDAETERAAVRGAELAEKLGQPEKLALITTFHGMLVMSGERTRFSDGLGMVEQAISIAQKHGVEQAAIGIARGLSFAYLYDGRFAEAQKTITQVVQGLEASGAGKFNADIYLGSRFTNGVIGFFSDDYDVVGTDTLEVYQRAKSVSNRTITSGSGGMIAWMHLLRGNYDEAKRFAEEALPIAETIGNTSAIRTAGAVALAARLRLGEHVSPGRYIDAMEQDHHARGDMASKSVLVVDTLISIGEAKRAKRYAALAYGSAGGRLREALATLGIAAALHALSEDYWGEAKKYYLMSLKLAEEIGSRSTLAAGSLGLGLLANAAGRDGTQLLQRSLALSNEIGLRFYAAKAEKVLAAESTAPSPRPSPADPPAP